MKPPRPERCERRIVGPIWLNGVLVTDLWIGDPSDPPLESADDMGRAVLLVVSTGLVVAAWPRHGRVGPRLTSLAR